jgi:hypothetical protein
MEQTASRVAILPRRDPLRGIAGGAASRLHEPRRAGATCTIHWFRREGHRRSGAAKRVAILDPFDIEQRLLVALAEAHGHRVALHHRVDDLLASFTAAPPEIAFVHMCFEQPVRRAAAARYPMPPVVLIDSSSTSGHGPGQLAPIGDFTALRFPIGLHEFAEAIRRNAH